MSDNKLYYIKRMHRKTVYMRKKDMDKIASDLNEYEIFDHVLLGKTVYVSLDTKRYFKRVLLKAKQYKNVECDNSYTYVMQYYTANPVTNQQECWDWLIKDKDQLTQHELLQTFCPHCNTTFAEPKELIL